MLGIVILFVHIKNISIKHSCRLFKVVDQTMRFVKLSIHSQIIRQRVHPHLSNSRTAWNTHPGGLVTRPEFSTNLADFPFFHSPSERLSNQGFTAVIEINGPPASTSLIKLIKSLSQATRLKMVLH